MKNSIAQQELLEKLTQWIESDTIPPTVCFVDRGGRGGLQLALAYAQQLVNKNLPQPLKIENHPDAHFLFPISTTSKVSKNPSCNDFMNEWRAFIDERVFDDLSSWANLIGSENKALNFYVDDVTELQRKLNLRSLNHNKKCTILWNADTLTDRISNKLLKIFEEPPKDTHFVLIVKDPNKLLPTISSRCQTIELPSVMDERMSDILMKRGVAQEELPKLIEYASGNLSVAFEQINKSDDTKQFEVLLIELIRYSYQLIKSKYYLRNLMDWSEKLVAMDKNFIRQFLIFSIGFFRASLLSSYGIEPQSSYSKIDFNFKSFGNFLHSNNIFDIIELFETTHYYIERNANLKILSLDLALQFPKKLHTKREV